VKGAGRPIWDDLASDEDLAVLDPGAPDGLPSSAEVVVVGGGVIGLAVAAACTDRGMETLLVERGRLAGQASGRAAGGLSPDAHPELGEGWRRIARRSLELHRQLDEEWDYGLRDVDLRVPPDLVIPDQAHVDPLRFCAALARRAGNAVTGVEVTVREDCTVTTTHGTVTGRSVVVAMGLSPQPDQRGSWVKGHLIATEPAPFTIDEILAPIGVDSLLLQLPSGHLVAGGTKEPGIDAADVDESVVSRIRTDVAGIRPECADLEVTHRWTCFRPNIRGDLPILTREGNVWTAAGFYSTGILMAPVVGEAIASAIAEGAELPSWR
jgi:glycine oxidase